MPRPADQLNRTRATLLARLANWDDRASWQEFFDIYWKLIYSVARRSGLTDAEAQDVVQDTMVAVARHMPTFKYDPAIASVKGWILNLTRWRVIDEMRRRVPRAIRRESTGTVTETATVEKLHDSSNKDLEAAWELEWEEALLEAALSKLKRRVDPKKYQIFDMYVNKNWAPEKVASTFGISIDQVYLTKHRLIELVKTEVDRLRKEVI